MTCRHIANERWAKIYNLKQMAAALQFLQEHKLTEYDQLATYREARVATLELLAGFTVSVKALFWPM